MMLGLIVIIKMIRLVKTLGAGMNHIARQGADKITLEGGKEEEVLDEGINVEEQCLQILLNNILQKAIIKTLLLIKRMSGGNRKPLQRRPLRISKFRSSNSLK